MRDFVVSPSARISPSLSAIEARGNLRRFRRRPARRLRRQREGVRRISRRGEHAPRPPSTSSFFEESAAHPARAPPGHPRLCPAATETEQLEPLGLEAAQGARVTWSAPSGTISPIGFDPHDRRINPRVLGDLARPRHSHRRARCRGYDHQVLTVSVRHDEAEQRRWSTFRLADHPAGPCRPDGRVRLDARSGVRRGVRDAQFMERVSGRAGRLDRRRHFDGLRRGAVGRRQAFGTRRTAAARPRLRSDDHAGGIGHTLPYLIPNFYHRDRHRVRDCGRLRAAGDRLDPVALHGGAAALGGGKGDDRRRAGGAGGGNSHRLELTRRNLSRFRRGETR